MISIVLNCLFMISTYTAGMTPSQQIHKNGMTVNWEHTKTHIQIRMTAPTTGWIAIGFNTSKEITGTYLLMGRIRNGQPELVEHYTVSPGDYRPISTLGSPTYVTDVTGKERDGQTALYFSLPVEALGKFKQDLSTGTTYQLIMAYSADDDFQHHSRMRTSAPITL